MLSEYESNKCAVPAAARWHQHQAWSWPTRRRRSEVEEASWQALEDGGSFELDNMRVDVRQLGIGPDVLLLHGNEGRGSQFMPLMEALAAAGMRAVAVDLPGFGDQQLDRITEDNLARAMLGIAPSAARGWHGIVAHSLANLWAMRAALRGLACERYVSVSGVSEAALCEEIYRVATDIGVEELDCLNPSRYAPEGEACVLGQIPMAALERKRLGQQALIVQSVGDEFLPPERGGLAAARWALRWVGSTYLGLNGCSHHGVLANATFIARTTRFLDPLRQ